MEKTYHFLYLLFSWWPNLRVWAGDKERKGIFNHFSHFLLKFWENIRDHKCIFGPVYTRSLSIRFFVWSDGRVGDWLVGERHWFLKDAQGISNSSGQKIHSPSICSKPLLLKHNFKTPQSLKVKIIQDFPLHFQGCTLLLFGGRKISRFSQCLRGLKAHFGDIHAHPWEP